MFLDMFLFESICVQSKRSKWEIDNVLKLFPIL